MASLNSYIKDRDERIKKGTLVYTGTSTHDATPTRNFNRLNNNTFKANNGQYSNYYSNR